MAFPTTAVPVVVKIAPGADPAASPGTWSWQDITSSVRLADRIDIVTGRQNEASQVDPARCTMRLDNTSGDFTPRNPLGQWYGQLGRNTPLRVQILRGEDTFARTASNGWGTADSGQAWTTSGTASDFSVSGGAGRHSHGTINLLRRTVLGVSLADVEQVVDVTTPALLTGAALVAGLLARFDGTGPTYYWLRCEFNSGGTSVQLKISKCVGGTITDLVNVNPVPGLAYAAGTPMRIRAQVLGNQLAMKVWPAASAEPSGWHLEVADDSITGAGATGVQSWVVGGNTNTLPLVVSLDNYTAHVDRFSGFVSSWPPRWDPTGNDKTVPIQADGVLRRLSKGSPPARSPLRRTIAATAPAAYWPGEDGATARRLASAVGGHPAMSVTGTAEFVQINNVGIFSTDRSGSAALVNLASGAKLSVDVPATVAAATASLWTVHVRADVDPAVISGNFVIAEWATPGGTYARWQILVTATDTRLLGITSGGSSTVLVTGTLAVGLATYAVTAQQVGGNMSINFWDNGTTSVAGTVAGVTAIASNVSAVTATSQVTVGHFAIWATATVPYNYGSTETDDYGDTIFSVGLSARLEAAHVRLARLCTEDGVQLALPSVPEYAVMRMGWQAPGAPLDLYRQCEATDGGVLHEMGFGLGYLPRDARYNRPVTLALDYAAGQIAPPFGPVDDDQLLRNRVTVSRIDGSEATAEDAASIATAGTYSTSYGLSISSDTPLPDHASWRLWISTADEMRWPVIGVNLARSPALIDAVLSCRVQSRATVANPLATVAGDDIDVLVEGYSETIGHKDWTVDFNTSPARVWDVATVDGTQRVAADGSTLTAGITASTTSFTLSNTAVNGPWTTDPTDFPLDVRVGGEQVTVSAISSAVSDAFARTTASGWGTADSGQAWTTSGGSASDYSVASGTGRQSLGTVNVFRNSTIDVGVSDQEYTVDLSLSVGAAAGAGMTFWFCTRLTDLSNYYVARLDLSTGGVMSLGLYKRVGGTLTTVTAAVSDGTNVAGNVWRVRVGAIGSALYASAVNISTGSVPVAVSGTDTSLTAGTQAGLLSRLEAGNTNTLPVVVSYDLFAVTNPQTVTASARGVNGVNRAWSAGTEVDVWEPAIAAL